MRKENLRVPTASKPFVQNAVGKQWSCHDASKTSPNPILNRLKERLKGRVVILGIGNALRGDDAFGSNLANRIDGKVSLKVLDAGCAPENFLGSITKYQPDTVLLIDAVDFGGDAGEMRLSEIEDIKTRNFFLTHNASLNLFSDYLKSGTKTKVYLLAVQPQDIAFGEKMSAHMEERLEELRLWFLMRYPIHAR